MMREKNSGKVLAPNIETATNTENIPTVTTESGQSYDVSRISSEEGYDFETDVTSSNDRIVYEFLCAQNAYINVLEIYSEVNIATQYAVENLILTQVGMKTV